MSETPVDVDVVHVCRKLLDRWKERKLITPNDYYRIAAVACPDDEWRQRVLEAALQQRRAAVGMHAAARNVDYELRQASDAFTSVETALRSHSSEEAVGLMKFKDIDGLDNRESELAVLLHALVPGRYESVLEIARNKVQNTLKVVNDIPEIFQSEAVLAAVDNDYAEKAIVSCRTAIGGFEIAILGHYAELGHAWAKYRRYTEPTPEPAPEPAAPPEPAPPTEPTPEPVAPPEPTPELAPASDSWQPGAQLAVVIDGVRQRAIYVDRDEARRHGLNLKSTKPHAVRVGVNEDLRSVGRDEIEGRWSPDPYSPAQVSSYDDDSEEEFLAQQGPQEDPNVVDEEAQNDAPSAEPTPTGRRTRGNAPSTEPTPEPTPTGRRKRGRTPHKAPENDVPPAEPTPEPTPPAKKKRRGRPPQKKKATMTPPQSADEYDEVPAEPTPETPPPAKKKRGRSKKATPPPENAVTEPTPKKKQEGSLWGPKSSEEYYAAIKAAIADFFALKDDTEAWYKGNKELWAHVSERVGKPANTLSCQFDRLKKGRKTEELLQDLQEAIDEKRSSGGVARSAKHPGAPTPQPRTTRQKRSSALTTTNPTPQKQDEDSVKLKKFREALIEQYRGDDDRSREFAEMCKKACAPSGVDYTALFRADGIILKRSEDGLRKRIYANLDYSEKELVRVAVERADTRELASRFDKTIQKDDDVKKKLAGILDLIDETDIDRIEKEYCVSRDRRVLFVLDRDGEEQHMVPCITLPRKYIHLNAKQASRQDAPKKMDHDAFVKFVHDPEADCANADAPSSEWSVDLNGDVGDATKWDAGRDKVFIHENIGKDTQWYIDWPSEELRDMTVEAPFYESFERHWNQEEE